MKPWTTNYFHTLSPCLIYVKDVMLENPEQNESKCMCPEYKVRAYRPEDARGKRHIRIDIYERGNQ